MKIGVLTSSRADFGIYLPLLIELKKDSLFSLHIIAFGTHLSPNYGYTINEIKRYDFKSIHEVKTMEGFVDDEAGVSSNYGSTISLFSTFWNKNKFDLVFCLGDRYEMSAAVQAAIPFRVPFAHLHGGETTLGAIDNIFRHQITLASKLHFATTAKHSEKIIRLTGQVNNIYNVGSLSLNDLHDFQPKNRSILKKLFHIPNSPYLLVTFHPETIDLDNNIFFGEILEKVFIELQKSLHIVITMPNADTLGSIYRTKFEELSKAFPKRIITVESFGKDYYFDVMHYSTAMLGNSSSGIIEAASFNKYVINVGNRQKGRTASENVYHVEYNIEKILNTVNEVISFGDYKGENIYWKDKPAKKIIKILKNEFNL